MVRSMLHDGVDVALLLVAMFVVDVCIACMHCMRVYYYYVHHAHKATKPHTKNATLD